MLYFNFFIGNQNLFESEKQNKNSISNSNVISNIDVKENIPLETVETLGEGFNKIRFKRNKLLGGTVKTSNIKFIL